MLGCIKNQHCLSDRFVGVAIEKIRSPLLLFSAQILAWRRRIKKCEMIMQPRIAPNCYSRHPDPRPLEIGSMFFRVDWGLVSFMSKTLILHQISSLLWTGSGKKNKFGHFLVVVQLIHRPMQAYIGCATTACLLFFPLLVYESDNFQKKQKVKCPNWADEPPTGCGPRHREAHPRCGPASPRVASQLRDWNKQGKTEEGYRLRMFRVILLGLKFGLKSYHTHGIEKNKI